MEPIKEAVKCVIIFFMIVFIASYTADILYDIVYDEDVEEIIPLELHYIDEPKIKHGTGHAIEFDQSGEGVALIIDYTHYTELEDIEFNNESICHKVLCNCIDWGCTAECIRCGKVNITYGRSDNNDKDI